MASNLIFLIEDSYIKTRFKETDNALRKQLQRAVATV